MKIGKQGNLMTKFSCFSIFLIQDFQVHINLSNTTANKFLIIQMETETHLQE